MRSSIMSLFSYLFCALLVLACGIDCRSLGEGKSIHDRGKLLASAGKNGVFAIIASDSRFTSQEEAFRQQALSGFGVQEEIFRQQAIRYAAQEEMLRQQALNHPVLKTVTGGAVGILFIMLTWRSLSSYELAEQFTNPLLKFMTITPTIMIMIGNLLGIVTNIMKPKNFKNIMKSILAANIMREIIESVYNVLKIIMNHSVISGKSSLADYVPKEIYFGRLFGNVWWMLLCISFSKSRWASASASSLPMQGDAYNDPYSYESAYPSQQQQYSHSNNPGFAYQQANSKAYNTLNEE